MVAASKSMRGMLCAAPGNKILCSDFSSIEARILAWFADEEKSLEAFRRKEDIYVLNASDIFHTPKEAVTKDQRLIGKVCELALGYQGWLGAFDSMAKVYGVTLEAEKTKGLPEEQAKEIRDDKAKEIILGWRAARQKTVNFWAGVLAAAVQSVKTGHAYSYGKVKFGMRGRFLHCRLPSGRLLSYCDPTIEVVKTKYGVEKEVIAFMGWNSEIKKWCKQHTYGGKLTENIVQATARDVLRDSLLRLDAAGFNIVLHIHDEVLAEVSEREMLLAEFERIMQEVPAWAEGCPIGVEGWEGHRYRK
jgi:DNA polymerase